MTEHTKEPWKVRTEDGSIGSIDGGDGEMVAQTQQLIGDDLKHSRRKENARRIAVCVNACAGLSTEILEKLVASGQTLQVSFGQALHANLSSPQPAVTQTESNLPKG